MQSRAMPIHCAPVDRRGCPFSGDVQNGAPALRLGLVQAAVRPREQLSDIFSRLPPAHSSAEGGTHLIAPGRHHGVLAQVFGYALRRQPRRGSLLRASHHHHELVAPPPRDPVPRRRLRSNTPAKWTRQSSPARWPRSSFMDLNPSRSNMATDSVQPPRRARSTSSARRSSAALRL
jgi:hypothetical protein